MFLGNGGPRFARAFDAEFRLRQAGAWVVSDTSRATYAAAGFHRGWWRTLGPRSLCRALRIGRRGFRQKGVQGDALQLGGALAVERGGRVLYLHAERDIGDHAPPAELTRTLTPATTPR